MSFNCQTSPGIPTGARGKNPAPRFPAFDAWKQAGALRAAVSLLAGLAILGLLFWNEHTRAGGGKFLHGEWLLPWLWLVPVAWMLKYVRLPGTTCADPGQPTAWRPLLPSLGLMVALVLHLVSGCARHPWFYFLDWTPDIAPDAILGPGLTRLVLLTALLVPVMLPRRRRTWPLLLAVLLLSQTAAIVLLARHTGGKALYHDDHPSFMFRLWEYASSFPQLVSYSPYWNGGVVNFVGTTSGTAALGLPLWPLWAYLPTHKVYTWAIAAVYILAVPWLGAASVRAAGGNRTAAFTGAVLCLGVSRHFFLWMLRFGTVGAALSSAFILPVTAAALRAWHYPRRPLWLGVMLAASVCMLIQWPPGLMMGAALVFCLPAARRRISRSRIVFFTACAAAVALLFLKPALTIATRGDALMSHVMDQPPSFSARLPTLGAALAEGWRHLWSHIQEGHPLLIFLGIGGVLVTTRRAVRRWCLPPMLVLALLAGWGPQFKPNLQLGRMAIPMFFIAVLPASLLASRILESRRLLLAVPRALLTALLILGGWNVARLYGNAGAAPYNVLPESVQTLADWTRHNTPAGSRLLFAGCCVHAYGRGHVAYLPRLAEREMMACDYYAFPPKTVEYNYPPSGHRWPPERFHAFLQHYNVGLVATYHKSWKHFLRRFPERYEEVDLHPSPRIRLFRVREPSGMFLKGTGRVSADFNRITVHPDSPREDVVLRYNWVEGLEAEAPAELFACDVDKDIRLLGVRPNGRRTIVIRFKSRL